jgi:hypothetical protein
MLKYSLLENQLTTDLYSCIAVVSGQGKKNLDDIIDYMIAEGTGLTRPQAMAYFEKLVQSIEFFIRLGYSVSTPLLKIRASITGVFTDKNDSFDPLRHQVHVKTTSGTRLYKLEENLKVTKVQPNHPSPVIELFSDATTGRINDLATPGGIGVVKGSLLKFDPSDVRLGVFFISAEDPEAESRASVYSGVRPSEVHFQIPSSLTPGEYNLVVRAIVNSSEVIRKGEFIYTVTAQ